MVKEQKSCQNSKAGVILFLAYHFTYPLRPCRTYTTHNFWANEPIAHCQATSNSFSTVAFTWFITVNIERLKSFWVGQPGFIRGKKIRNAVQKTKFYLNKLLEVFVLLQGIQITKGFGVIQAISLILRVNLSTKLLRKNDRKQRWSLTRQLNKMEWEQSRKGNMVEIPTSVKAETTEAVLPNCVGCSLWNTRRRFFANRVLTCKTNVMKRKFITRSNDESVFHKNYEYGVPLKE